MSEAIPPSDGTGLPDSWRHWISQTRVCARLEINHRQLKKLVDSGDLPPGKSCPDGTTRWDPAFIDQRASELELGEGKSPEERPADMAKAQAQSVGTATNHVERMVQLLERPIQTAMAMLRQTNADLREENESLRDRLEASEQMRSDMIRAREELLSEQAAREIAARESASRDERKKAMFEIVAKRAPGVLDALGKTLGINKADQQKVNAVIELANDLDPALLETLASSGALDEKQIELVETIIGKSVRKTVETTSEGKSDAQSQ